MTDGRRAGDSGRRIDENEWVKVPAPPAGNSSLKYTFSTAQGTTQVALAGAIDENADLSGLFDRLQGDTILNLRDVDRVNSMGVHGWVPLINKASSRHRLVIEELSYALVQS